jgi:hypothetical protein
MTWTYTYFYPEDSDFNVRRNVETVLTYEQCKPKKLVTYFLLLRKICETEVTCTYLLVEAVSGSPSIKIINHHGNIKQQEMLNRPHYFHDEL